MFRPPLLEASESTGRTPLVLLTLLLFKLPFVFRLISFALPFVLRLYGDNSQKLEPERKKNSHPRANTVSVTTGYFGANNPVSPSETFVSFCKTGLPTPWPLTRAPFGRTGCRSWGKALRSGPGPVFGGKGLRPLRYLELKVLI